MKQTDYIDRLMELHTALVDIDLDLDCAINGIEKSIVNGRSVYHIHQYSYSAVVKAHKVIKLINELLKVKIDYEIPQQSA